MAPRPDHFPKQGTVYFHVTANNFSHISFGFDRETACCTSHEGPDPKNVKVSSISDSDAAPQLAEAQAAQLSGAPADTLRAVRWPA